MSRQKLRLGRAGERVAWRHLRRHGLRLVERNWRCRSGELDIVARDGDMLVIVEVRTSGGSRFAGAPALTVGPDKQARLRRLALLYQQRMTGWKPRGVRIDVVGVTRLGWLRWQVDWFPNAVS